MAYFIFGSSIYSTVMDIDTSNLEDDVCLKRVVCCNRYEYDGFLCLRGVLRRP